MAVFNATEELIDTMLFIETKFVDEMAKNSTCSVIKYTPGDNETDAAFIAVIVGKIEGVENVMVGWNPK